MKKRFSKALLVFLLFGIAIFNPNLQGQNCWAPLSTGAGVSPINDYVAAMVVYNGNLVAAGKFNTAGGNMVSNIAMWNGNSWSALGSGIPYLEQVNALAVYQGELYVSGQFDTAGGAPAKNIAKWNGSTWSTVGGGLTGNGGIVEALEVYNNELYAIGSFDTANGVHLNNIAKWNGSVWADVGGGFSGELLCMAVANGNLYIGGEFHLIVGADTTNDIIGWNGSQWTTLSTGIGPAYDCQVFAICEYNGNLYAGGTGLHQGGSGYTSVQQIGMWNGTSWSDVGGGIDQAIYSLFVYGGQLIAGGNFTTAGAAPVSNLAHWNGATWSDFGGGIPGSAHSVSAIDTFNGNLYLGGDFNQAGTVNALSIAEWTCATGITEIPTESIVTAFPNPGIGLVNLSVQNLPENSWLEIFNIVGDRVSQLKLNTGNNQINLTKETAGIYFYTINTANGPGTAIAKGKIVIQ